MEQSGAKRRRVAWLIAGAMSLSGCMDWRGGPAWEKADAWYRFPPRAVAERNDWNELEAGQIHAVADAEEPAAEALLNETSFRAVSSAEADQLAGGHIALVSGTRLYLVRSVYLNKYTGAYRILLSTGNIWVRHGSLGHHAVPMRRQALILQLSTPPTEAFATCSMAE